jgi:hypothetical protein
MIIVPVVNMANPPFEHKPHNTVAPLSRHVLLNKIKIATSSALSSFVERERRVLMKCSFTTGKTKPESIGTKTSSSHGRQEISKAMQTGFKPGLFLRGFARIANCKLN